LHLASPLYPPVKPKFYEQIAGNAELHDLLSNVNKEGFLIEIVFASFTYHEIYFNTASFVLFTSFQVSEFFGYCTFSDFLH
jgi:hypothetical protein